MGNGMNDAEYNELCAVSWRRKLAPAEELQAQAYQAAHPEAQADWEEDLALTRHLQELPDPPLSSNFTARVLQSLAVEQDRQTRAGLERRWGGWLRRLAPRMALAGLTVALALGGVYQYQSRQTRKEI